MRLPICLVLGNMLFTFTCSPLERVFGAEHARTMLSKEGKSVELSQMTEITGQSKHLLAFGKETALEKRSAKLLGFSPDDNRQQARKDVSVMDWKSSIGSDRKAPELEGSRVTKRSPAPLQLPSLRQTLGNPMMQRGGLVLGVGHIVTEFLKEPFAFKRILRKRREEAGRLQRELQRVEYGARDQPYLQALLRDIEVHRSKG